ncbi:unnamed protein product [Vitrella brassicaformis CCMP3155]|uniref:Proteasome subunit alpha type n=1 Tax=Vitrella brassicaformis (strain CCMP3155) TaxID=1169540 RepID=A0A0G4EUY2_VITBC|nr:unnamed protein product [Vitrella brassicaformis CCMP3155]|eukprot:CEM02142.1 unnamed protein product [Vitrella brassicaformis CCMP3155]
MFATRSEYDRGVNTFSPEGRLFQVEYAIEAVKLGSTAVGIQTSEGVILAVERRLASPLVVPSSIEKIYELDYHIGCAMSGLIADARTLADHARTECANHFFTFNERMSTESCVHAISDLALDFSDVADRRDRKKLMSRPFGVSLLVAGVDDDGPSLWKTDPTGTYSKCTAAAIGSASESAQGTLQEQYNKSMTLKEAEDLAVTILKQVMEEKLTKSNAEIASVSMDTKRYHLYTPDELQTIIDRVFPQGISTEPGT